ncbi:MAG: HAD-IA family hydrolase [Paracoccaceae bacterium]|nr:HAD-IA family hydrolase [Paracoccaceae bacterium]
MTPPPKAVIFDCDGVLVDSEPMSFELLAQSLRNHGLVMTLPQMEAAFLGGTIRGVRDKARALGADLPENWVEDFYALLYARLAQGTALIPGILAVLDRLDVAGVVYAVGSNGTMRKMQVTLGQHPGLMDRFAGRLFSGQDLGMLKPAPDLYLHAGRVLGAAAAHCVVIEDSPTGARAAARAGMVCHGYAPHGAGAALKAEGARVFRDMSELPRLLGLDAAF